MDYKSTSLLKCLVNVRRQIPSRWLSQTSVQVRGKLHQYISCTHWVTELNSSLESREGTHLWYLFPINFDLYLNETEFLQYINGFSTCFTTLQLKNKNTWTNLWIMSIFLFRFVHSLNLYHSQWENLYILFHENFLFIDLFSHPLS